jgi:cytochrome c oxidase assembly protein subunit 11
MNTQASENRRLLVRLGVGAVAMFAFGFALVPFYNAVCKVTGLRNILQPDVVENSQVDKTRSVLVEFDANTRHLAWQFKPLQASVEIHPGELVTVEYEVTNIKDEPVTGQAVPSYGPQIAGNFFKKVACFCFEQQTLQPKETRVMPVVFVVDPKLPDDVHTITLSYTFFEVAGTRKVAAAPGGQG